MNHSDRSTEAAFRVLAISGSIVAGALALAPDRAAAQCGVSVDCPFKVYAPSLPAVRPIVCHNIIVNSGFEDPIVAAPPELRHSYWWQTSDSGVMPISQDWPFTGEWGAWLGGYEDGMDRIGTQIAYPLRPPDTGVGRDLVSAELTYAFAVAGTEAPNNVGDVLSFLLVDQDNGRLTVVLDRLSSTAVHDDWALRSVDVTNAFRSRPGWGRARLEVRAVNDALNPTSWFLDDIGVVHCAR
jgi:hypothetical protein